MPDKNRVHWDTPVELSAEEERICQRCKRTGRLYGFLRRHRHELFDRAFERELAAMYADSPMGQPPLPPAMLAIVTILQAANAVSDAAAVEEAVFDRRWQMVLGSLDENKPPFSQGALVDFRRRLINKGLHHRLVDASVALAKQTGEFGYKQLRVAMDSAPLWGAGRVEDTFNLIGHALQIVVTCAAKVSSVSCQQVHKQAGLTLLGHKSLKGALDIDWDDDAQQHDALARLLADVQALKLWLEKTIPAAMKTPPLSDALSQLERIAQQDIEPDPNRGGSRIKRGTAKERQISLTDPAMRHGRKSRSQTIKGYKRFIARELDHGLIMAVTVQPANQPEHHATDVLRQRLEPHGTVASLHIDRGFLSSSLAYKLHEQGHDVRCRPWRIRNGDRFPKTAFRIDLERNTVTCPAGKIAPIQKTMARFESKTCADCSLRTSCTRSKRAGRTVSIHPHESLFQKLHADTKAPEGRRKLRERTSVEHGLAHICNRQGPRARYRGIDNNVFDLCRYAVIENCFAADRIERRVA